MLVILDRLWRAARFTSSYADPLTDSDPEEDNFEEGLDFQDQDESISGIRRRLSEEASVSKVGEALNQTLGADRVEAAPRDHFSPVQVRFPVNAPALRPPVVDIMPDIIDFDVENGVDGDKAQDYARAIKVDFEPNDIRFWFSQLETEMDGNVFNKVPVVKKVSLTAQPSQQTKGGRQSIPDPEQDGSRRVHLQRHKKRTNENLCSKTQ